MNILAFFSDGLPTPDKTEFFDLVDGYGTKDTIKRGRFVTRTTHSYIFYDIYLDNGKKLEQLTSLEGADCVLHAYKFQMRPF